MFTEQRGLSTICLRPTLVTHPEISVPRVGGAPTTPGRRCRRTRRAVSLDLYSWIDAEDFTEAVRALAGARTLDGFHALAHHGGGQPRRRPDRRLARTAPSATRPFELRPGSVLDAEDPYHGLIDCSEAARVLGWRGAACVASGCQQVDRTTSYVDRFRMTTRPTVDSAQSRPRCRGS